MKLSQLKYFQAVCKYNNMTLAANELHISQPSLSNAIKELENEFGVVLFLRSNNRLALTEEGETLLSLSGELLQKADALLDEMKLLGSNNQEVSLGVPPALSSIVFPKLFQKLQGSYPDTKVLLKEYGTPSCIKYLKEGSLNVALVSGDVSIPSYFGSIDICTLKVNFYTSSENPLSQMSALTQQDFTALQATPLILLNDGTFIHSFVNNCFHENHLTPNVILRTNQLHTVQQLVAQNIASTFLYEGAFPAGNGIVSIPLEENSDTKIRLIWNCKYKPSTGVQSLLNVLQTV